MNKEEMIKEMARVLSTVKPCDALAVSECIKRKCEYPHFDGVTCIAEHKAEALYNAGYRKIADDEIVVKKSEYEALKKATPIIKVDIREQFLKECEYEMRELEKKAKHETAREILQEIKQKYGRSCSEYYPEYIELTGWELNKIANKYGIELG